MRVRYDHRSKGAAAAIRGVLRSEDGVALVLGLVTVVVMLLITTALVVAAVTETLSAQVHEDSGRALNVAEAGGAHAIGYALRGDTNWSDAVGATAGDCGVVTFGGTDWLVLRDTRPNIPHPCLKNVPYPNTAPVQVTRATGGGGGALACGSETVEAATGGGTPLPEDQRIGTYTVAFHPTRTPGTLTLRVTGTVGRATRGIEFLARRVTPADFVAYSASTVDATVRSGSGTMSIHGSVYIRGDWAFKGNAGQYNDRPVTTDDATSPPFENQTFVCNNLELVGSAEIGQPTQPMRAVHIAGSAVRRGGGALEARIHANRRTNVVPDIGLGDVARLTRCIKGVADETSCENEFGPGTWNSYTNHLDPVTGDMTVIRWNSALPVPRFETWLDPHPDRLQNRNKNLIFDSTADTRTFLLPKRTWDPSLAPDDQVTKCISAANANLNQDGTLKAGGSRQAVLAECALYYEAAGARLFVAGFQTGSVIIGPTPSPGTCATPAFRGSPVTNQVIYVPGRVLIARTVTYTVDGCPDDPTEQREKDTAVVVASCDINCGTTDTVQVTRGSQLLAEYVSDVPGGPTRLKGSRNLHFGRYDLLAFLANGTARLEGWGNASTSCTDSSDQEQNAVFVVGGTPGETFTKFRLQLFGGLISRQLVLQDDSAGQGNAFNVRWCQIPDLGELVGATLLGRFLNDPRNSTVIMRNWREVGF
jgi:hypothetical protein